MWWVFFVNLLEICFPLSSLGPGVPFCIRYMFVKNIYVTTGNCHLINSTIVCQAPYCCPCYRLYCLLSLDEGDSLESG